MKRENPWEDAQIEPAVCAYAGTTGGRGVSFSMGGGHGGFEGRRSQQRLRKQSARKKKAAPVDPLDRAGGVVDVRRVRSSDPYHVGGGGLYLFSLVMIAVARRDQRTESRKESCVKERRSVWSGKISGFTMLTEGASATRGHDGSRGR